MLNWYFSEETLEMINFPEASDELPFITMPLWSKTALANEIGVSDSEPINVPET